MYKSFSIFFRYKLKYVWLEWPTSMWGLPGYNHLCLPQTSSSAWYIKGIRWTVSRWMGGWVRDWLSMVVNSAVSPSRHSRISSFFFLSPHPVLRCSNIICLGQWIMKWSDMCHFQTGTFIVVSWSFSTDMVIMKVYAERNLP